MKVSAKEIQKTIQAVMNKRKRGREESPVYSSSDESDTGYEDQAIVDPKHIDTIGVVPPESDELALMEKVAQRAPLEPYDLNPYDMQLHDRRGVNMYDWVDKREKTDVYRLRRIIGYKDVIALGEKVFDSLSTYATKKNMCSLMLLAYNLQDSNGRYIFETRDKDMVEKEYDFESIEDVDLSDDMLLSPWSYRINAADREKAISFCYIACSFMRLYTKSAENFKSIPAHIAEKFTNFYDFDLAVLDFKPAERVINSVKNQMNTNEILKNTFYLFLYAGEGLAIGSNLKDFLYGIHTSYTGLHSFTLFMRCMDSQDVSNIQLASALDSPLFRRPLKALVQVFKNLTGCRFNEGKKRHMWKYARIFEPRFLYDLQTKNCVIFAYCLAYLYKKSNVITGKQNPLNIVQFKGISEWQRNMGALAVVRVQAELGIDLMTKNMVIVTKLVRGEIKVKKPRRR